jgi:two-component system, OmpR family, sensor histidine kinase CiaH
VQALFGRIRWRLVGWNMLILGLILVLLGTTVYVALSRSLLDEVDRNLFSRSEQAIPNLFGPRGDQRRGPAPGQSPAGGPAPIAGQGPDRGLGTEGYSGGVFYLALLPSGVVLANPQQVTTAELPWPESREPTYATIQLGDGDFARVVLRRTPDGGMLVVGQSLEPEQTALHSLVLVLVAGAGLGLLLSLAAAWFLSGRALIPIQQAFQRQQEFVADASHELRTPLTVLRSATDVLNSHRDERLDENGELFDDVRAEIIRMERLAQDLLTLARSDAGGLELMTAPLELADVAAEVVRRTTPHAQSAGIQLSLHADPQPATVEADPDRLQQVLLILIDNAIKHTPPGGKVEVRVRRQSQSALVEVADTGTGIAPEHLPRIFDRFYRADKARARAQGGTGLGLAIAKMLIEAHGGHLQLSSTLGVGTQVSVLLPLVNRPARLGGRFGELAAHLPRSTSRQ